MFTVICEIASECRWAKIREIVEMELHKKSVLHITNNKKNIFYGNHNLYANSVEERLQLLRDTIAYDPDIIVIDGVPWDEAIRYWDLGFTGHFVIIGCYDERLDNIQTLHWKKWLRKLA